MVASVAVLSDIHGVLPALEAVLAEPDVITADLIAVTGDHAAGPQPREVLDRLRALGDRALLIRGNADRELAALARGELPPDQAWEVDLWAARRLRDEDVELLAHLPHPVTREVDGFDGRVVFCHGTPRDDAEVVLVDTRLDRWAEVFADVPDDVRTVVCGHTHMPYARLVDGRLVVNSGSVGMPYGRPGASWALLRDGQVQLRHTPFDVDAAVARVAAESAFPAARTWADHYVRARTTDAEALRAFGPRDGRTAPALPGTAAC
ncbi:MULTISPECIES: metallophosphoesterase family protein [Streptomyces]|uniref:metallophosphoesterase family protein n=1 Tax=Streptomyces TaxID=1883 RepID=UPI00163BE10A|nr:MULTISPECIES: metallophosphoesterase family protein [Streptomyces]MBC2876965.1 metallophosphoesterase family protein [Streptomyces sp. TYQ1024]UBI35992.1 metallophosphatase family protein [Streptomyces mobaraensis]UKW28585.1 metallophosphatase family protein [Streptomyces sp. TYQ1024]